ncbi:MAG TPA: trypsin-like peptidase domain-containing protein [Candidatus Limnocylindrales bacterium]
MVTETRRLSQGVTRRLVAKLSALAFAGLLVAACGSAAVTQASPHTNLNLMGLVETTTAPNTQANLSTATAAPTVSLGAASGAALSLQEQMVAVIKQVTPQVVQIETDSGLGSGIIYDSSGDIITNAHVVSTAKTFKVTLSNGKTYTGSLVGSYTPDDIAVIKITAPGLSVATFADSSTLSVGDFVLAMGNPLGLQSSVTEGIISALGRTVSEPAGNALPDTIQTSAAINPGNSGGALVDLNGSVVGIPTLEATDAQSGGNAAGIGFAISSNRAKLIADQLIASGKVTNSARAYFGVSLRDGTVGPVVMTVTAGGPAAIAGLVVGDIVTSIDGVTTADSQTVIEQIAAHHPGDVVQVAVQHQDGTTGTYSVTLTELPA